MKVYLYIVIILMCMMLFPSLAKGDEFVLMERDEAMNGFFALSNYGQINAKSPFRVGDTGTGADDFVTITGTYNEPRPAANNYVHKGLDLSAKLRNTFCVYRNQLNLVKIVDYSSDFGNFVVIQHQIDPNNYFAFQSLYVHLNSTNVIKGQDPNVTTKIGVSGNTGASLGYHLHLQFPCATNDHTPPNYTMGSRNYAPAVFYGYNNPNWVNGNDTSFINHLPNLSSTTLHFRCLAKYGTGNNAIVRNVLLHYKESGETSWNSMLMKPRANYSGEYYLDVVSDLDYSLPVTLQYYVSAETDAWNGGPFYTAYRPYRYKYTAPTDRPFTETFSTNLGTVSSSEPNLDRSSYCNVYDADIDYATANAPQEKIPGEMITGAIKEKVSDHLYLFESLKGDLFILEFDEWWDTSFLDNWLETKKMPFEAVIVGNISDKTVNGHRVIEVNYAKSLEETD